MKATILLTLVLGGLALSSCQDTTSPVGPKPQAERAVRGAATVTDIEILDIETLGHGSSGARGIDEIGRAVGITDFEAFIWSDGGMTTLPLPTVAGALSTGEAWDINGSGRIVGRVTFGFGGGVFQDNALLWTDPAADPVILPTLGGDDAMAFAINPAGTVVGQSEIAGGELHATMWVDGLPIDLGMSGEISAAADVNASGEVVGTAGGQAVLWQGGSRTILPSLGGTSVALAINDVGQIVGASENALGDLRAVRWETGSITDLGTLGGDYSIALDIDEEGHIVGGSTPGGSSDPIAFIWVDGVMTPLGTLGGGYSAATAINDFDQIAGESETATGELHATLWTVTISTASPEEEIADLGDAIDVLETAGSLSPGQGRALRNKLRNAQRALDRGNVTAAIAQLEAFIRQVHSYVRAGILTELEAAPLIEAAERAIAGIRGT